LCIYSDFDPTIYDDTKFPSTKKGRDAPNDEPEKAIEYPDWFVSPADSSQDTTEQDFYVYDDGGVVSPEDIGYADIKIPRPLTPGYILGINLMLIEDSDTYYHPTVLTFPSGLMFKPTEEKVPDWITDAISSITAMPPKSKDTEKTATVVPGKTIQRNIFTEDFIPLTLKDFSVSTVSKDIHEIIDLY
jgi:hypothetical protein